MTVAYAKTALRQIHGILTYLEDRSPSGARNVGARRKGVIAIFGLYPETGRATDRPKQRRIVVTPYRYVVFYRVDGLDVTIQRVRHASRRPMAD